MSQTLSFTVQTVHEGSLILDHLEIIIGNNGNTSEVFMNSMPLTNVKAAHVHINANEVTTVTLELMADRQLIGAGHTTPFPAAQEVSP